MAKLAGGARSKDGGPADPTNAFAAAAILSNGRYSVLLTPSSAGWSSWKDLDVTRWREDATRDCWGSFCYVRDLTSKTLWSIGHQPVLSPDNTRDHSFHRDRAEFSTRAGDIEISWAVCVDPHADAEIRALTVENHGAEKRSLEFTSYAEVCLNNRRADMAHPAFAKLFVETEYDPKTAALFARRRPRDAREKPIWGVHVSASSQGPSSNVEYETDRAKFLGRGRTAANPSIFDTDAALSGTTGPVLDPIFCLRRRVQLEPGEVARVAFVTGAGDDRAVVQAIAERFTSFDAVDSAFSQASERCRAELQNLQLNSSDVQLFYRLIGRIAFADPNTRQALDFESKGFSRSVLWSHGISGDLPILLARLGTADEPLIREVLSGQEFSLGRGLRFDVVLFDECGPDSANHLAENLAASSNGELLNKPGGIFVLSSATASDDDMATISAAARVVLLSNAGSLAGQLDRRNGVTSLPAKLAVSQKSEPPKSPASGQVNDLLFWNGFGGFSPDGREYSITVEFGPQGRPVLPPAPWSNVLANQNFGCLTTEAGFGYSWSGNSQSNRLTPWSNDPVSDTPGEVLYLRDEETGEIWTPTPLPLGKPTTASVQHGQGYTRYEAQVGQLHQILTVHVPPDDAIKVVSLRLNNIGKRTRHLSATYFAEWVLGTHRENAAMQLVCKRDPVSGAVVAKNLWSDDFAGKLAFAAASPVANSATSDRTEFLGKYGSVFNPAGLKRTKLAERFGSLQDPCAALMVDISLAPGESKEVVFVLGQADGQDELRKVVRKYADPQGARESLAATSSQWDDILNTIQVSTPDTGLNLMMNRWLLYQVLACRVWARTSNYQSGGAYGFRDQLQDVMALVYCAPDESRTHILRSAARQFREGDVQHWWHPPSGVGVRTRMTDDLYFLPYVVQHYVLTTGDIGLLEEKVPFINSPVLRDDQEEDFNKPEISEETATVYEHCIRALEYGLRLGAHGLPLMGTGDWNDGMNKVGAEGRGESVWNGWFFLTVLRSFAPICTSRGDTSRAEWCLERAEALRVALEATAWDGAWYRRAYFDDGTPLGSSENDECQIDALPQAWSVISGQADRERAARGMEAVYERLVRESDGLIALFEPPFDAGTLQPGYIKGYVPGIRENGGQYTHAAAWVVWATALMGDGERALRLWNLLNPINHGTTEDQVARYKVEPYVVCADVYGAPPHTGRGGWSWYTGSAGWIYRVALEAILGFCRHDQFLLFQPCVPASWSAYEVIYRHGRATYEIRFDNSSGAGRGVTSVTLDGVLLPDGNVPLKDEDLTHHVRVIIGQ